VLRFKTLGTLCSSSRHAGGGFEASGVALRKKGVTDVNYEDLMWADHGVPAPGR